MILILSSEADQSTSDVVEWMLYQNKKFILINKPIQKIDYSQKGKIINVSIKTYLGKVFNYKDISSVWYRRGRYDYPHNTPLAEVREFLKHENLEWGKLNELLMLKFNPKHCLGNYFDTQINKNDVLLKAARAGLKTPITLITDNKSSVIDFFCEARVINKTIAEIICKQSDNKIYRSGTIEIKPKELPNSFYPSLFQELVEKKYELRIFYIKGAFFSSAIFSQNNKKTSIDFRNYDYVNPNRVVPFKLPQEIESKLVKLMGELNLNTGSIDMMVTPKNKFYFLEVNPVGQFGMVSYPCNYYCEKFITETLN